MKSERTRWLLVIVAFLLVYTGHQQWQLWRGREAVRATQLEFHPLETALARAKAEGKPVLVDFTADWCPSCRQMHQSVFTDPMVQQALGRGYVLAMVNSDAAGAAAVMDRYGVRAFPTLLVLDGDGQVLRSLPVTFDPVAFANSLPALEDGA